MGFAVTRFLLEAGVKVVMTAREQETLRSRGAKMQGQRHRRGSRRRSHSSGSVDRLREAVETTFGPADILVHAAGITDPSAISSGCRTEDWTSTIDINFMAAVRLCRAFIPRHAREGLGPHRPLLVEDGLQPYIEDLPYCACKAAIINLAKGLSKAYGAHGLTVNSILPAFVASPMTDAMMEKRGEAERCQLR